MIQIVNLESSGDITFRSKYKLIWYKKKTEIFHENEKVNSYNIEQYFENGKSIEEYIVMPREIMNVDLYIKENIKLLMMLWMDRSKKNSVFKL